MNASHGDEEIEGVISNIEVLEVNENGEKLVDLCMEKGKREGRAFFKKKDIHKFAWVSGVDDSTVEAYWTSLQCRRLVAIYFWK